MLCLYHYQKFTSERSNNTLPVLFDPGMYMFSRHHTLDEVLHTTRRLARRRSVTRHPHEQWFYLWSPPICTTATDRPITSRGQLKDPSCGSAQGSITLPVNPRRRASEQLNHRFRRVWAPHRPNTAVCSPWGQLFSTDHTALYIEQENRPMPQRSCAWAARELRPSQLPNPTVRFMDGFVANAG